MYYEDGLQFKIHENFEEETSKTDKMQALKIQSSGPIRVPPPK